jgi:hypothetical protein
MVSSSPRDPREGVTFGQLFGPSADAGVVFTVEAKVVNGWTVGRSVKYAKERPDDPTVACSDWKEPCRSHLPTLVSRLSLGGKIEMSPLTVVVRATIDLTVEVETGVCRYVC